MEFRAFLKGKEQSGATALLIRALSDLRVISGGWALVELERADGSRVKGLVEPCQAATAVLPFDVAGAADTDSAARFGRVLAEIREKDMGWLDPVLGPELADADCAGQLGQLLGEDLPLVGTIAPRELAGDAEAYDRMLAALEADMEAAARKISEQYGCAVLCKGGHDLNDANDLLWKDGAGYWFNGRRINNPNTHGTGCTLSSAIAANLAKGMALEDAVRRAKEYISGALAAMLDLGHGRGPMNHLFDLKSAYMKEAE